MSYSWSVFPNNSTFADNMNYSTSDVKVQGRSPGSYSHEPEKDFFDIVPAGNSTIDRTTSYAEGEQQQLPPEHTNGGTKRNIKSRHAQMMAIGGAIGTSLFLGTGQALAIGGPAFLFLAYCK